MTKIQRKLSNTATVNLLAILFISIASIFTGARDVVVGIDTLNYIINFKKMTELSYVSPLFEPGFQGFTYIISYFSSNVFVYLTAISFLLSVLYLKVLNNAYREYLCDHQKSFLHFIVLSFVFIYASNFFLTANINGIRQGLAAPFVFMFFQYILTRKKIKSLLCAVLAVSFHYTSILYIAFFLMVFFSFRSILLLFTLSASLYFLGIFEVIVQTLSSILGVPIYTMVKSFSETGLYEGFNALFFLFSLFPLIAIVVYVLLFSSFPRDRGVTDTFKIYAALIMPYFVLGFAGYTNRYAFTAWLFMPIFFGVFFFRIVKPSMLFYLVTLASFIITYFLFLTKMFVW